MTAFLLVTLVMAALTILWLTRPLWQRASQFADTGIASILQPHRSLGLGLALALFVVAVLGIGYVMVGAPAQVDVAPAGSGANPVTAANFAPPAPGTTTAAAARDPRDESAPIDAAADSLTQAESRVSAMVDSLAKRLKTRPDDADGWQLLGRSYASLGRHALAVPAFKNAQRLHPADATLLAELAFSSAVLDPHGGNHEPVRLIARALELEPENPKALALAGTLALDRKDYQSAIQYWEHLARIEPAGSPIAKQLQVSIVQARQLAGTQATLAPVASALPVGAGSAASIVTSGGAGSDSGGDAARKQVSGTVSLAPALMARASPDDTVFVFARSAGGPRMPLAVLKKQVKDLPLRFTLDDSLAMSPSSKLSSASNVVVGARIAKGGNAVARDGDLQGQLAAVPVGSADLQIQINEVVGLR